MNRFEFPLIEKLIIHSIAGHLHVESVRVSTFVFDVVLSFISTSAANHFTQLLLIFSQSLRDDFGSVRIPFIEHTVNISGGKCSRK